MLDHDLQCNQVENIESNIGRGSGVPSKNWIVIPHDMAQIYT